MKQKKRDTLIRHWIRKHRYQMTEETGEGDICLSKLPKFQPCPFVQHQPCERPRTAGRPRQRERSVGLEIMGRVEEVRPSPQATREQSQAVPSDRKTVEVAARRGLVHSVARKCSDAIG